MDASSSDAAAGVMMMNKNAGAFPTTFADSLNASCFTFRKARSKLTREKASRAVPATKSFRKIGSCEDDRAVEERKVGMRECWRKIDAKFESVLREANLEAVSGVFVFVRWLARSFFRFMSLSLCVFFCIC
jgi:hypothetical protein